MNRILFCIACVAAAFCGTVFAQFPAGYFTGNYGYFYDKGNCGARITLNHVEEKTLTGKILVCCKGKEAEGTEYPMEITQFSPSTKTFYAKIPGYPRGEGPWFGRFKESYVKGKYDIFFKLGSTEIVYEYEEEQ
ncbi:MAG: hypothetical protein NZ534_04745 [Bacteroidia bacterium]|nr:hypothetical protein [Bacteroidia bacterium]